MAAGQGFKTFVTGEVLTSGDVNGYLMQGINVFATTAARDAAITAPAEGQFAFTKDTNSLWYYDGAAWVASGATGDIEGVTAGVGISGGGTSGTVTITNSMATAIDAKGDLVAGTGADAFSRIAVGTNGQVLKANSAAATGLEWGSASATKSFSQIATASLSGSSSVTVSGLSGYDDYLVIVLTARLASGNSSLRWRLNGNTGNVYTQAGGRYLNGASYATNLGGTTANNAAAALDLGNANSTTGGWVDASMSIRGGNSAGLKILSGDSGNVDNGGSGAQNRNWQGFYDDTNVISSVTILTLGSTFDLGSITVYGAV